MSLSVRSPFSSHLETPGVSDLYKTQSTHFPSYLLQDVLTHLNVFDLLSCRRVCRLWYEVLQSRRLLREKLFLKQPDTNLAPFIKEPSEKATFELHPIFSTIHFTSSLCAEDTTFGRKSSVFLKDSAVRNNYATSPVTTRISLGVLKFHPDCIVENPTGVTVWDVIMRLAEYKAEPTHFTYHTFFGSKICHKRGYNRYQRMTRKDMLGQESVFISFDTRDPKDNRLFIADSFESREGAGKGRTFRFWSAFSFCEVPENVKNLKMTPLLDAV